MEENTEVPVDEETERSSSPMKDTDPPTDSTAAPPPPSPPEDDSFYQENKVACDIMDFLNFTVQPRRSNSNPNPNEATFDEYQDDRTGERECSSCKSRTGEKHIDDFFKKLEADVVAEKEKEIERLANDLKKKQEAGLNFEKKITQLVEFISFIHGEFGKLVRSFVSLTSKNLDACNVLNLGPFQDEAETDEFLEGLNSLAKQLLDEFENLGDTKNLLEKMNKILKASVDANTNLNVPEDIEETCSQEYENVNGDDADVRVRSRSSVSTVVLDPEILDMIEDHPSNPPPKKSKLRMLKRKKVIKTEINLESANKRHGLDYSRRHLGHFCLCGCKYSTKTTLKAHIKYMTWEWRFSCDICKKGFPFASRLRFHLRTAHGVIDLAHGAFTCSQCGESFDSRKDQIHHSKTIHRNGVFEGPSVQTNRRVIGGGRRNARGGGRRGGGAKRIVNRRVQQSSGQLHGVDRGSSSAAFQCICGNIYSHKSALSVHISTKRYGKIFKCKICGKRFDIHADLKKHVLTVHNTDYLEGKYGCGICGKACDSMMDLKIHRQGYHGIEGWGRRNRSGRGRGKKTLNKVTTGLPEEDEDVSAFGGDDDPQPPKLMAEANYDEDFQGNQTEPDAIDVDYETNDDGRVPSPLEPQRSSSPPIEFQVDEDSSNEVICVE